MQNFLAISAMGANRTDPVEPLLKAIRECGCNIMESRVSVIGDRCAIIMLLSGTWDTIAKIEPLLTKLEDELDIKFLVQRTSAREPEIKLMPYAVEVVAADQVGLVHQIVRFFIQRKIYIGNLYSENYTAAHTGTRMFSLHMTVSIATDISIAAIRNEFIDFCDQLNLDAVMEPVK